MRRWGLLAYVLMVGTGAVAYGQTDDQRAAAQEARRQEASKVWWEQVRKEQAERLAEEQRRRDAAAIAAPTPGPSDVVEPQQEDGPPPRVSAGEERRRRVAAQARKLKADARRAEAQEKKWALIRELCGERPDGTHWAVRQYLKQVAHDPSSIQIVGCREPELTDSCWQLDCQYRGKNSFGALVLNTTRFYVRGDAVLRSSPLR